MYFTILHNKCSIFTGKTKMQIDEKNLKIFLSKVKDQLNQRSLPQKRGWGWVLFVKRMKLKWKVPI